MFQMLRQTEPKAVSKWLVDAHAEQLLPQTCVSEGQTGTCAAPLRVALDKSGLQTTRMRLSAKNLTAVWARVLGFISWSMSQRCRESCVHGSGICLFPDWGQHAGNQPDLPQCLRTRPIHVCAQCQAQDGQQTQAGSTKCTVPATP